MDKNLVDEKGPVCSRVVAIIQARMGSTRLPGKVLAELSGKTILWHVVNRVRHVRALDRIVVATTLEAADEKIARWCEDEGVDCFRGSSEDVLDRYYRAALEYDAAVIVRITSDCPLLDPSLVDMAIAKFQTGGFDHVSVGGNYPDGLDTEVFSFAALAIAWKEARLGSEREHVTPFIWKQPERFRLFGFSAPDDYSTMRWTVDDERDLSFVRAVCDGLGRREKPFGMQEILDYLELHPQLLEINAGTMRNEGYAKSLCQDAMTEAVPEAVNAAVNKKD